MSTRNFESGYFKRKEELRL